MPPRIPGRGVLRALPARLLLWSILPLVLLFAAVAFSSVYVHQRAMRAMVLELEGRRLEEEAGRLAQQLALGLATLDALAAAHGGDIPPTDLEPVIRHSGVELGEGPDAPWAPSFGRGTTGTGLRLELAPVAGSPGTFRLVLRTPMGLVAALRVVTEPQRELYLLEREGRPLAGSAEATGPLARALAAGLAVGQGHRTVPGPGGERLLASAPAAGTDWGVVVVEPFRPRFGPAMTYSVAAPLVLLAALASGALGLGFVLRDVLRPLRELGERASRLAWGETEAVREPVGGVAEIEELRLVIVEMADQLHARQQGLESYSRALTRGQEDERLRLARELHDETSQQLVSMVHRLDRARRALDGDPEAVRLALAGLRQDILTTLEGVRRLSQGLRPSYLEDLGLLPALESLAGDAERDGPKVRLRLTGEPRRLGPEQELGLFRIAQEALRNVERHAAAGSVRMELRFAPDEVRLEIADDGRGFQPPASLRELVRDGHLGLLGMRERTLLLGGRLEVQSQPGQGTRVTAILPTPGGIEDGPRGAP